MSNQPNLDGASAHPPMPLPPAPQSLGLLNVLIIAGILGILAFVGSSVVSSRTAGTGIVSWRTDFDAAVRESASTGRPVLLNFSADWCPPCRRMKAEVWTDSAVADYANRHYIPTYINTDANPQVAGRFSVSEIPTVMILTEGKITYSQSGFQPADVILGVLKTQSPAK